MSAAQTTTSSANPFILFRRLSSSVKVWIALVAWLVFFRVVITNVLPQTFADPDQRALLDWLPLAIFSIAGLIGVLLSERSGFPEAWDPRISNMQRIVIPLSLGIVFGIALTALDLATGFTKYIVARHGLAQQYNGFLPTLLSFSTASILVQVIYRLVPIPLLLWLISNVLLRGRRQNQVFWVLAIVFAFFEPFTMTPDLEVLPGGLRAADTTFQYVENFTEIVLFRKYGYFASVMMRVGFYLVWHALYIH
jgi:hypothetical protein